MSIVLSFLVQSLTRIPPAQGFRAVGRGFVRLFVCLLVWLLAWLPVCLVAGLRAAFPDPANTSPPRGNQVDGLPRAAHWYSHQPLHKRIVSGRENSIIRTLKV